MDPGLIALDKKLSEAKGDAAACAAISKQVIHSLHRTLMHSILLTFTLLHSLLIYDITVFIKMHQCFFLSHLQLQSW